MSENKKLVDNVKQAVSEGTDFAKSKVPTITGAVKSVGKTIADKGSEVAETAADLVGTGAVKAVDLGISAKQSLDKAGDMKNKAKDLAHKGKEKALSARSAVAEKGSEVIDAASHLPPVVSVRESAVGQTVGGGAKKAMSFAGDRVDDLKEFVSERVDDVKAIVFVKPITAEEIALTLDLCYEQALSTVDERIAPYMEKHDSLDKAARELCRHYMRKSSTSKLAKRINDLETIPEAVPDSLAYMWLLELEMCTGIASIGDFDVKQENVKTLLLVALTGQRIRDVLHKSDVHFGEDFTKESLNLLTPSLLTKLKKDVYQIFEKKFAEASIVSVGKAIPLVGGVISGGFDFADTTIISRSARHFFIDRKG